jgi:hypothetical protein
MELVDEIYNEIEHVEPWMSGNARGPSSAFCLLFRLFTMELEDANIKHLIHHRDSPYIRALGGGGVYSCASNWPIAPERAWFPAFHKHWNL